MTSFFLIPNPDILVRMTSPTGDGNDGCCGVGPESDGGQLWAHVRRQWQLVCTTHHQMYILLIYMSPDVTHTLSVLYRSSDDIYIRSS